MSAIDALRAYLDALDAWRAIEDSPVEDRGADWYRVRRALDDAEVAMRRAAPRDVAEEVEITPELLADLGDGELLTADEVTVARCGDSWIVAYGARSRLALNSEAAAEAAEAYRLRAALLNRP